MANKAMPTTLKKEGRRNVIYRDTRGKTYMALVTARASGTSVSLVIRSGGMKRQLSNISQATTGKQTNVWFFPTGH